MRITFPFPTIFHKFKLFLIRRRTSELNISLLTYFLSFQLSLSFKRLCLVIATLRSLRYFSKLSTPLPPGSRDVTVKSSLRCCSFRLQLLLHRRSASHCAYHPPKTLDPRELSESQANRLTQLNVRQKSLPKFELLQRQPLDPPSCSSRVSIEKEKSFASVAPSLHPAVERELDRRAVFPFFLSFFFSFFFFFFFWKTASPLLRATRTDYFSQLRSVRCCTASIDRSSEKHRVTGQWRRPFYPPAANP